MPIHPKFTSHRCFANTMVCLKLLIPILALMFVGVYTINRWRLGHVFVNLDNRAGKAIENITVKIEDGRSTAELHTGQILRMKTRWIALRCQSGGPCSYSLTVEFADGSQFVSNYRFAKGGDFCHELIGANDSEYMGWLPGTLIN